MESYAALLTIWPAIYNFIPTAHTESYPFISPQGVTLDKKGWMLKIAVIFRFDSSELQKDIEAAAKETNRPAPQFLGPRLDVSSEEAVADAAAQVEEKFGSLDILFNKTGTSDPIGVYLVTRAFIPLVLKYATKTVINVSSCGAHVLIAMSYQTSKMAVTRLTEFMANEFGPQGLVAISIHPGNCLTDLSKCIAPEELHGIAFPETSELAGDTIVWLGSQRREWPNGRFVSVWWDMKELEHKKDDIIQRDVLKFRLTF
ncbi:NAD(P)-binding protein [Penicillium longicatenatum]|nr:NAD(P)-binding protein [Penicillium longicatenatum]